MRNELHLSHSRSLSLSLSHAHTYVSSSYWAGTIPDSDIWGIFSPPPGYILASFSFVGKFSFRV